MLPTAAQRLATDTAHDVGLRTGVTTGRILHRCRIAIDHLLDHPGGRDARQVGATGRGSKRQAETNKVVGGIADDGLVKIADLDFDTAVAVRKRTEVSKMAIATNPDSRPLRNAGSDR